MELLRALGTFCWPPDEQQAALAALLDLPAPTRPEWHATFVERWYPYGSVYLSAQGFVGGEVRDAAAGVFRALDAEPPKEADHLGALLDAYATVDANGWAPARTALLWEHILPWALPWLDRLRHADAPPYRPWAALLWDTLLDAAAAVPAPDGLPPSLLAAPDGLADPRTEPADDFVSSLLAPVRLGAIITRDDLLAAARELDLPGRVAERRYVLRGMLGQDPAAVIGWVAAHCVATARRTAAWPDTVAAPRAFWSGRATSAGRLLGELSRAAVAA
ncbi:MAG: hypothetical protein GEU81_08480 [Nitriliruptorales bacterium]|nr:hypothetical protein [Nitriliruptorales bacterium]